MLDIELGKHRDCDGVSRRDFIRVGALGAFGLTMPGLLAQSAKARAADFCRLRTRKRTADCSSSSARVRSKASAPRAT